MVTDKVRQFLEVSTDMTHSCTSRVGACHCSAPRADSRRRGGILRTGKSRRTLLNSNLRRSRECRSSTIAASREHEAAIIDIEHEAERAGRPPGSFCLRGRIICACRISTPRWISRAASRGGRRCGRPRACRRWMVRDRLRGRPSNDIDIEVFGIAQDRLALPPCAAGTGRASRPELSGLQTGATPAVAPARLTSRCLGANQSADAVTKGFEVHGDPSMSVAEAARRRDFTINAIASGSAGRGTKTPSMARRTWRAGSCAR